MGAFVTLLLHHPRPFILLCTLFLLLVVTAYLVQPIVKLSITNRCSYTVWPAAMPVGGGVRLDPGKTWTIRVPENTKTESVWARTGCSFDAKGNGSCQTGECDGVLACKSNGQPPYTSADFALGQFGGNSFFDISLYDGFNVPMNFLPLTIKGQVGPGCSKGPRCVANITS